MRVNYPFAAIVGQETLQDALLWLAVDPYIGGLLISGTRGTAKSTAARALADLLPDGTPFVELPVGATEDRVVGSLDVHALLSDGGRRFEPGLLARANHGVLYVDEVNLLPDHIVDVLLDAAAMGVNVVERDGASHSHEALIMLIGSMNPEEGELRPQLLDRFGLCVHVENDADVERRTEITARRIRFDLNPEAFIAEYDAASRSLRRRIACAREMLPHTSVDRSALTHASRLAVEARVEGMRADLTIIRTARAIAALDSREHVVIDDVERAAHAALAHRRREPPPPPQRPQRTQRPDGESANGSAAKATEQSTAVFDVGSMLDVGLPESRRPKRSNAAALNAARGRSSTDVARGIARASATARGPVAPLATIRAAALEKQREEELSVDSRHLRYVLRRGRERQLVIFLIDASGSMAAAARMRAAKGAVSGLLEQAYYRRDAVALIAFRGSDAEVVVPPTRSAVFAYRRLRTMATGGRTPLAQGLRLAEQTARQYAQRDPAARSHVVLVSDARANVPEHHAFEEALARASELRLLGVRALCVDTENGRVRLGNAVRLAHALGATYRHLSECTDRSLGAAVREWMAIA